MTTKYASPLAEARAELITARSAALVARIASSQAVAARDRAEAVTEHWAEQFSGIARLPDRPTYEGPDGMAVSVDGSPFLNESGLQANRPDIYCPPPPSAETLDRLEAEVVKAERREKTALKAEIKARGEWVPPTDTGWVVLKPRRIAGIQYAIGDAFDPTTVEPRKVEQFKLVGLIGHG